MISRKAAFALAALLVSTPALAKHHGASPGNDSSGNPVQDDRRAHHKHRGAGMTAEQRIMFRTSLREQTKGMPRDQRHAFIRKQRQEFRMLSAEQKQQRLAGLDQRWNAMPQEQRDRFLQKIKTRQERHKNGKHDGKKGGKHHHKHDRGQDNPTE